MHWPCVSQAVVGHAQVHLAAAPRSHQLTFRHIWIIPSWLMSYHSADVYSI